MGKKQTGENSKKVAGNARKADAAAQKQAVENERKAKAEAADWADGAKSNAKKEAAEAKKAEAARKKAERDAELAEEEKNARTAPKNKKTAEKKTAGRSLNLDDLDSPSGSGTASPALNASGIDNALDALTITGDKNSDKVERHPERRFKAALAAYEERRMPELEQEQKGLRLNQRRDIIRKEFERHEDNPFNQARVQYNATREELSAMKSSEREKIEKRLGS